MPTFKKRIQTVYSLGSTEEAVPDDQDDEDIARDLRGKTLAHIFTARHANLTSVIMILMAKRDMRMLVQEKLLDPNDVYWETGKYTTAELEVVSIDRMHFVAAGRVQQVVIAGLQILYDTGHKKKGHQWNKDGDNYSVLYYSNKEHQITNIRIMFKFNDQDVNLSIIENGDDSYMSLYIED